MFVCSAGDRSGHGKSTIASHGMSRTLVLVASWENEPLRSRLHTTLLFPQELPSHIEHLPLREHVHGQPKAKSFPAANPLTIERTCVVKENHLLMSARDREIRRGAKCWREAAPAVHAAGAGLVLQPRRRQLAA